MNGLAVSVGNVYSDYFILYPTRIVVNTRLHPSNYESIKPTVGLNITMDNVSLDLSRNNCEILLLIWNVYRHLFETKNNSIQSYNGNNNKLYSMSNTFDIILLYYIILFY